MVADSGRLSRHRRGGFPRRWQGGAEGEKGKPRPLAAIGFFAPTQKNGPASSVDGIGIALTGRGCPVPPQGRGGGPAASSCAGGFAVGPAVAWCSGSAVIVTGATGIAGSDAGKKSGGNKGGTPTGGTSKAGRGGSITATGNGSTGQSAACGA